MRKNEADHNEYVDPFSIQAKELALSFDEATDENDLDRLEALLDKAQKLVLSENEPSQAYIFYSIGTAYSDFSKLKGISFQESVKKRLYFFRKSIGIIEKDEYNDKLYEPYIFGFKEILYTNYANALDECGRKIAAIDYLKKVLAINDSFGMALGNLGRAYQHYASLEYDETHRDIFHHYAYECFVDALKSNDPNTHQEAKKLFQSRIDCYDSEYVDKVLKPKWNFSQFSYDDPDEYVYRKWCLNHGLFLNTLNDLLVAESCFMADVIQLPDMITDINSKPVFHGMFSQLKQEYIYARYLYYKSMRVFAEPLYADKETYILSYTDYAQYSIRLEQLKTSFKTLYSIFDKIAYFINYYFDLGIKEHDITFRSIWFEEGGHGKNKYQYKNTLDPNSNFALATLYWINKDFYDSFEDSPNPELKRIKEIRNALEHKYVKIYASFADPVLNDISDGLALYISEEELAEVTMQLLKILREAIISLSLSVNIAEKPKREETKDNLIVPMSLMEYEDDWKI